MKPGTCLFIVAILTATTALAQKKPVSAEKSAKQNVEAVSKSSINAINDLDSKVQKMKDLYDHLNANVQDQQVNAELQPLLSKMSQVINEYNDSKSLTGVKLKKSRQRLESKVRDVIKMHSNLKSRFGAIVGDCC